MTSRITIEYDFGFTEPYIQVIVDKESNDMRDQMLSHFFEMCMSESTLNFCYRADGRSIIIYPTKSKLSAELHPRKG